MTSYFQPLRGASNPHLQTLLPRLLRRKPQLQPFWQRLTLPDGDFVDLAWSENPDLARHKPRAVLFHGLEGNFYSPYAHGLLQAWQQQGWLGVVMHFRGCSGEPNRRARIYHSGETSDARYFLRWLQQEYGSVKTAATGVSLGGNMLACYLADYADDTLLDAAVIVSAPLMLAACANRMERGLSIAYNRYLLRQLQQNVLRKWRYYPETLPLSHRDIRQLRSVRDFDNALTAPLHGFHNAADYYERCSALPKLSTIKIPLLIIHAQDDPFMDQHVIPDIAQLPDNIEYQLTTHGGHVGFVGGTLLHPQFWLEQRIPAWLTPYLREITL